MIQAECRTQGCVALPRLTVCNSFRVSSIRTRHPICSKSFDLVEKRRLFVAEASSESPGSTTSDNSFWDYALGEGLYQVCWIMTGFFAVTQIFSANWVAENILGITLLPVARYLLHWMGAFLLTGSVMAFSLKTAANAKRMYSPVYKRLSFSLALNFGVVGLLLVFGPDKGIQGTTRLWLLALMTFLPSIPFFKFYGAKTLQEIIQGVTSGASSVINPENVLAGIYSVFTAVTLGCGIMMIFRPEASLSYVFGNLFGNFAQYLTQCLGLQMYLLSIACFTLKDASDRNRLGYTTYKNLSTGVCLTSVAMISTTIYLAKYGPKLANLLVKPSKNSWIFMLTLFGLLALVSGYNTITAKRE